MRVRYTPQAFADREAIFEYINRRNPRGAREIKAFVEKRILALGELEIRHRAIPKLGVHALWLGRYPYIVYYRVGRDEIAIVHIRHTARKPNRVSTTRSSETYTLSYTPVRSRDRCLR